MNIQTILIGLSFLIQPGDFEYRSELIDQKVIENRTSMGGIFYTYEIKNTGNFTLLPNTYKVEFRVDGKLVSFDRNTTMIKPGGKVTYKSQKTFYPTKKKQAVSYRLETIFIDSKTEAAIVSGESQF